jgi:LAS superfamily LD-carboxypeptidase LdcB
VQRDAYDAYKRMLAAADADLHPGLRPGGSTETDASDQYLRIISAFRSREYQDQLRRQSPKSGRAGLAVNSPHFSGRALDLYVGGDPVNTRDDNRLLQTRTPVYRWLVKNAAGFGFKPYFYEPWHWEYCPEPVR